MANNFLVSAVPSPLVRYEAAPATGTTLSLPPNYNWMFYTNGSTVAAETITLPLLPVDGQFFLVSNVSAITALTFTPAVSGFANGSALTAGQGITLSYSATLPGWFVMAL